MGLGTNGKKMKKGLDKSPFICYNKGTKKRKEVTTMWAWLKKFFEEIQEKETLEHYSVRFYTTDGIMHNFTKYRYAAPERLRCSVPEYIMIDVKSNGYLKDDNGVMYPLQNVVSIYWSKDDEIHDVKLNDKYAIFFDKPIDK